MASLEAVDMLLLLALVLAPAVLLLGGFRLLAWLRDDGPIEHAQNAGSGRFTDTRLSGDRTPHEHSPDSNSGGGDADPELVSRSQPPDISGDAVHCRACGTINVAHATYCRSCLEEV